VLVTAALVVIAREIADLRLEARPLAVVVAAMAATLMVALALVSFLSWRITSDRRSLYIATACLCYTAAPLLAGVVLPSVSPSDFSGAGAAFQIAGVPALVVYGLAARDSVDLVRLPARLMVPLLLVATVVVAGIAVVLPGTPGIDLEPGTAATSTDRVGLALLAVAWAGVAVAHGAASRRGSAPAAWCWAAAAAGAAVAHAIGAAPGDWAGPVGWGVMAIALLTALVGATTDLQRQHDAERQHLRDALVRAVVATSRAQSVDDGRAEQRHDARAALLGIEAAAQGLAHQRDQLTTEQWSELSTGLVAEIHRLGTLLDDGKAEAQHRPFDLQDSVIPVVACARAEGLAVTMDVAPDILVDGSQHDIGRALLTLLDNARVHAEGVDVRVGALVDAGTVFVHVDDGGPGVPSWLRPSLFERGACGGPAAGSGLGLHVARRLVARSGGALTYEPRVDGGSRFVVCLPLATAPHAADERDASPGPVRVDGAEADRAVAALPGDGSRAGGHDGAHAHGSVGQGTVTAARVP
jgi:signal transduction histidine kinase